MSRRILPGMLGFHRPTPEYCPPGERDIYVCDSPRLRLPPPIRPTPGLPRRSYDPTEFNPPASHVVVPTNTPPAPVDNPQVIENLRSLETEGEIGVQPREGELGDGSPIEMDMPTRERSLSENSYMTPKTGATAASGRPSILVSISLDRLPRLNSLLHPKAREAEATPPSPIDPKLLAEVRVSLKRLLPKPPAPTIARAPPTPESPPSSPEVGRRKKPLRALQRTPSEEAIFESVQAVADLQRLLEQASTSDNGQHELPGTTSVEAISSPSPPPPVASKPPPQPQAKVGAYSSMQVPKIPKKIKGPRQLQLDDYVSTIDLQPPPSNLFGPGEEPYSLPRTGLFNGFQYREIPMWTPPPMEPPPTPSPVGPRSIYLPVPESPEEPQRTPVMDPTRPIRIRPILWRPQQTEPTPSRPPQVERTPSRPPQAYQPPLRPPQTTEKYRNYQGNLASNPPPIPDRTKGILFGGLNIVPLDPEIDPPPYVCFNCWRRGHKSMECPQQYELHCKNCGRWGLSVLNCPRCAHAHRVFVAMRKHEQEAKATAHKRAQAQTSYPQAPRSLPSLMDTRVERPSPPHPRHLEPTQNQIPVDLYLESQASYRPLRRPWSAENPDARPRHTPYPPSPPRERTRPIGSLLEAINIVAELGHVSPHSVEQFVLSARGNQTPQHQPPPSNDRWDECEEHPRRRY